MNKKRRFSFIEFNGKFSLQKHDYESFIKCKNG